MADGRRSREAEVPLDERYWDRWELYIVGSGFDHVAEGDWNRFMEMVTATNRFGKSKMKEIHREACRAKIRLVREQARAG